VVGIMKADSGSVVTEDEIGGKGRHCGKEGKGIGKGKGLIGLGRETQKEVRLTMVFQFFSLSNTSAYSE
jgi:hypothetical protein